MVTHEQNVTRFWSKVKKTDGCWLWTGSCRTPPKQYGQFSTKEDGRDRNWMAHRFAFLAAHGRMPGPLLMHVCNNPSCVRPDHLREGTQKENIAMAVEARRMAKGSRNGSAKLEDEQVREILWRYKAKGESQAAIARDYGVSQVQVSRIVLGQSWGHIRV